MSQKNESVLGSVMSARSVRTTTKSKINYLLATFPALTELFIHREIEELKQQGLDITVFAFKKAEVAHGAMLNDSTPVYYADSILITSLTTSLLIAFFWHPLKVISVFFEIISEPATVKGYRMRALRHFLVALHWGRVVKAITSNHIHAHYANGPATVAYVIHRIWGIPFSFTAHAFDIYYERFMLKEKVQAARFAITCTEYNKEFIQELLNSAEISKLICIHHGVERSRKFRGETSRTVQKTILSVGSLVEQKGFYYLIKAVSLLGSQKNDLRVKIIGSGPLEKMLHRVIEDYHLKDVVSIIPYLPHHDIENLYREATLFVLPSIIATNGERDGIPNVLAEAMAHRVPVISTFVSGIPELIEQNKSGILVPERNAAELSLAIETLLDSPHLRKRLARAAIERVNKEFSLETNVRHIFQLFMKYT